jgi:hypothetical protein
MAQKIDFQHFKIKTKSFFLVKIFKKPAELSQLSTTNTLHLCFIQENKTP